MKARYEIEEEKRKTEPSSGEGVSASQVDLLRDVVLEDEEEVGGAAVLRLKVLQLHLDAQKLFPGMDGK